ncbi:MAG: glycosyltransferase family 2 protein [Bacteroidetes bacterium]|nr:glycosyltransferase family 2 protein [Bacteroidota bacterium]
MAGPDHIDERPPPAASVVTTVYNRERSLARAVTSVLGQSFTDYEYIIVDDGSTDDSAAIAESFDDPRVQVIRMPHRGRAAALNTAFELCRGEIILIQDSDDVALPERFTKQVAFLRQHPDVGMVGCQLSLVNEDKGEVREIVLPTDHKDILSLTPLTSAVAFCASGIRVSLLLSRRPFDETMPAAEDYDFQLKHLSCMRFHNLEETLQKKFTQIDSLGQIHKVAQDQLTRERSLRFLDREAHAPQIFYSASEISFQRARVEYYYGELAETRRILFPLILKNPWQFRLYRFFIPSLLGSHLLKAVQRQGITIMMSRQLRRFSFLRKHFLP